MSSDGDDTNDYMFEDDVEGFDPDMVEDDFDSESEPDLMDTLSPTIEAAPPKKPYDVAYNVRSMDEIRQMQQRQVEKVQTLVEVPASSAAVLLRHYEWNSERLQEDYWNDPAKALDEAGLSPPGSPTTSTIGLPSSPSRSRTQFLHTRSAAQEPFACPICCEDYAPGEVDSKTFALGCDHRFCRVCWRSYLTGKILEEGESARIQCAEAGCRRVVREEAIEALVEESVANRYHRLLTLAFVADSPNLRWCPHPGCEYAIECSQAPPRMLTQLIPTVTCKCGNDLCFGCGAAGSHRPVICKIVKMWQKKCSDDSETANWLSSHTKECPKCQSTIEKNGGCNHMTCKKCKWEFCWVCMGPWSEHGTSWYQCNRFEEKSGVDARDAQAKSRASLDRYLHYFNRFANHEQSAKLDAKFYEATEKKMDVMQSRKKVTWIEVQFARDAVRTVIKARQTLKWTYALGFYLARNNMTEIFEDNQRDLERAVEDLSYILELEINDEETLADFRSKVTNRAAYVQSRHDILLDDTLKGYLEVGGTGAW